ncbi:MAG: TadE family protein [Acidimicrobiia bacterium]
MTRRHDDRGAATTELVLLTPVLIVMLLFVVALGRIASTRQDVDAAARDAARAAANARSPAAARTDGTSAAEASLTEQGIACRNLIVTVDTAAFRAGGTVTAAVSCAVDLADLTSLSIPSSRTITATFTAPVDQYRGVS